MPRARTTLLVGFVLGATRLILELVHGPNQEGLPASTVWAAVAEFNFLHLAVVLFVICVLILITVSMATSPPPDYKIAGLAYGTAEHDLIKPPRSAGTRPGPLEIEKKA